MFLCFANLDVNLWRNLECTCWPFLRCIEDCCNPCGFRIPCIRIDQPVKMAQKKTRQDHLSYRMLLLCSPVTEMKMSAREGFPDLIWLIDICLHWSLQMWSYDICVLTLAQRWIMWNHIVTSHKSENNFKSPKCNTVPSGIRTQVLWFVRSCKRHDIQFHTV